MKRKIVSYKKTFPSDWELILLGHHSIRSRKIDSEASIWNQVNLLNKFKLSRPSEKIYGAYGYIISQRGAKKILSHLNSISIPVDHYTGDSSCVNLYMITPPLIVICDLLSETYHSMNDRKLLQEAQSLIEKKLEEDKKLTVSKKIFRLYVRKKSFFLKKIIILFNKIKFLKQYN